MPLKVSSPTGILVFEVNESSQTVTMNPQLLTKNSEYQQFAMAWYKEAIYDIHATLTK